MKHIHECKMVSEADLQMRDVKKGDTVVVHRVDTTGKEDSLVCVITLCANTSCTDCVVDGLGCTRYKGLDVPGVHFAFVSVEDAVE